MNDSLVKKLEYTIESQAAMPETQRDSMLLAEAVDWMLELKGINAEVDGTTLRLGAQSLLTRKRRFRWRLIPVAASLLLAVTVCAVTLPVAPEVSESAGESILEYESVSKLKEIYGFLILPDDIPLDKSVPIRSDEFMIDLRYQNGIECKVYLSFSPYDRQEIIKKPVFTVNGREYYWLDDKKTSCITYDDYAVYQFVFQNGEITEEFLTKVGN